MSSSLSTCSLWCIDKVYNNSVAATKTPIIFLGVGEHLHDLDKFSPQPFISKLLGLGDVQGLVEHMQDMLRRFICTTRALFWLEAMSLLEGGLYIARNIIGQMTLKGALKVCLCLYYLNGI